jgi:hypothetical protein
MNKIIIVFLFITMSCSTSSQRSKVFIANSSDSYYQSSGYEKYILPRLPKWANFSQGGQCLRSKEIRYIDFEKIQRSFNLSYYQTALLQYEFNKSINILKADYFSGNLNSNTEEKIFNTSLNKVKESLSDFEVTSFSNVHLFWIDEIINNQTKIAEFKKILEKHPFNLGVPVIVSHCLGYSELSEFISENNLDLIVRKYMSSEFFAPYNSNKSRRSFIQLNLSDFFSKQKEIILFSHSGKIISEFQGDFKIKKL